MIPAAINLQKKFELIRDPWNPGVVAELNGQMVKLVKMKGEFEWHHHENEDELFFVVKGSFDMHFRERIVTVGEGEMIVVPRMMEHKPVAPSEVWVMLFEPASTLNTGNTENEFTKKELARI